MAALAMLAGVFPLGIALGVFHPDPSTIHAPLWVLGMCGAVFVMAGILMLMNEKSVLSGIFGGILCLCFAAIGGWVALYAPSEGFDGGVPLLPDAANSTIARLLFGSGALMSFAIAIAAFRGALKRQDA